MVERSLSMREVPGSIPGSSMSFFFGSRFLISVLLLIYFGWWWCQDGRAV